MTVGLWSDSIAKQLRAMREREGISLRRYAKKIGVSPATLSRLERGYNSDLATLDKICSSTGVSIEVLLGIRRAPR